MKAQGPVLASFMRSDARIQVIRGPLGSGKTVQCCQKILKLMQAQAPNANGDRLSRWYAVRNTYPDLFDTTIKDWRSLWGELGEFKLGGREPPQQALEFMLDDDTRVLAEIMFLALDRAEHVKKLRGVQATGFWMNETKELPKAVFDMADLRHGRYPSPKEGVRPSWHGIIGDTNSFDEDHWLFELMQNPPDGWEFFHQPGGVLRQGRGEDGRAGWLVNPDAENLANLPPEYYARGMAGKDEDWIAVNLANEYGFVVDGKPVHKDFLDRVHVWPSPLDPVPGVPVIIGVDFGLTPAAVFLQRLPVGRWIAFDEIVAFDMGIERFGQEVKAKCAEFPGLHFKIVGDPAGDIRVQTDESTPFRVLRKQGFEAMPARTNDVTVRREALGGPLRRMIAGRPGIIISPKCKMLRKALAGGFCYKRVQVSGTERFRNEPDKNEFSHVAEACEYGLLGGGEDVRVSSGRIQATEPIRVKPAWSPFD